MNRFLPALLTVSLFAAAPAVAADHDFEVSNRTSAGLTSIAVQGGQVIDFQRVASSGNRNFTLRLPDGVCATRLIASFDDGDTLTIDYDACNEGGIALGHEGD
ncbi:hypothetical protein [Devosia aurantiaca]|uniref:Uncharacterized protein n=1 Tax=Devosia aurantiaca TaxID=2714858 RepID=A0A6M1T384_9HYPH|nr:hypothetical protein [Devosia aurantiaca]NGP19271.1 hypothetical protein [Devosia aurantiaca]